jgi:hypothetical protein
MTVLPRSIRATLLALLIGGLLAPAMAFAREPKTYQVTGKVLELDPDLIVVDKAGEKFEIARDKDTKVDGDLKVGSRVTIHYRMRATSIDEKESEKSDKK